MRACAASSVPASCQISCYAQRFATLRITQPASANLLDMIFLGQSLGHEGKELTGRHTISMEVGTIAFNFVVQADADLFRKIERRITTLITCT
jgi:hypothetical protein